MGVIVSWGFLPPVSYNDFSLRKKIYTAWLRCEQYLCHHWNTNTEYSFDQVCDTIAMGWQETERVRGGVGGVGELSPVLQQ